MPYSTGSDFLAERSIFDTVTFRIQIQCVFVTRFPLGC